MKNEIEIKLDKLLKYYRDNEFINNSSADRTRLEDIVKKLKLFDYDELIELTEILFEDKYVNTNFTHLAGEHENFNITIKIPDFVKITAKGRIFILRDEEGYVKKMERQKAKDWTQKFLNVTLIFGSLSAGLYYLVKGILWICSHIHCCHYHP